MKLLVVDDDELIQASLKEIFKEHEVTSATTISQALKALSADVFAAAFLDIQLDEGSVINGVELLRKIRDGDTYLPCIMISGIEDPEIIRKCLDLGAVDYVVKGEGTRESYKLALHKAVAWRRVLAESPAGRTSTPHALAKGPYEMLGKSKGLQSLGDAIIRVGALPGPFMILGETGSGKELVARQIWKAGGEGNRPFIALNCASLPENLVESELFGYERGAFTGALSTKTGLFEAANGGDIFLDEIGELGLELQAKLLRVLQEKKVRRLGSDRERPVSFRVIAATHVDILGAVESHEFREDLFFRLNVHQIHVPPLRERREDVTLLAKVFFEELGVNGVELEGEIKILLESFPWPGNIRQLKSFCQAIFPYLSRTKPMTPDLEQLKAWMGRNAIRKTGSSVSQTLNLDPLSDVQKAFSEKKNLDIVARIDGLQRSYVEAALNLTQNNRSQAAKLLGVSRQRLSNWLAEWGIS